MMLHSPARKELNSLMPARREAGSVTPVPTQNEVKRKADDSAGSSRRSSNNQSVPFGMTAQYIDEFDGSNVRKYFDKLEQQAEIEGWSEEFLLKLLRYRLTGDAYDYVSQFPNLRTTNAKYKDVRRKLLDCFDVKREGGDALTELHGCKQEPGESVSEFASRLRKLRIPVLKDLEGKNKPHNELFDEVVERLLGNQFKQGVRADIQTGIRVHLDNNQLSFEEAVVVNAVGQRQESRRRKRYEDRKYSNS